MNAPTAEGGATSSAAWRKPITSPPGRAGRGTDMDTITLDSTAVDTTTLQQRLESLLPLIRARRADIERERRLPGDVVSALRNTGVFALEVPRALGGAEASPVEILRAIETVSRADGSTGWCTGVSIANSGAAGFTDIEGAREVMVDPAAPTAGVFAPSGAAVPVDGGVRVNGRWQFASGVTHSDWVWVGSIVMENGQPRMTPFGPDIVYTWVPSSTLEIHDTWRVSGLAGTGSHDISVSDLFVPQQRIFRIGDPNGRESRPPLYRMPDVAWFVAHIAAVALGIARGALDELIELADKRVPTFSTAPLADRAAAQLGLARAEASLGAAQAFLHETIDALWQAVSVGEEPTGRQVALARVAAANAAETGATVARTASTLAGGTSIFVQSSLQRHMRDAEALAHHFTVAPHVWEDAGRVFLGRKPVAPMF
jgi:alkylation response protein AidB-like acyl-CoA dehydrogenase